MSSEELFSGGNQIFEDKNWETKPNETKIKVDPSETVGPDFAKVLNIDQKKEIISMTDRITRAAKALKDSSEAYKLAGVPAQSEDIRALAITFMIDEGKNGRMPGRTPQTTGSSSATVDVDTNFGKAVNQGKLSVKAGESKTLTVVTNLGIETGRFGEQASFEVLVAGEYFTLSTKAGSKLANALTASVGKEAIVSASQNGKFLNYSCKVDGKELIKQFN